MVTSSHHDGNNPFSAESPPTEHARTQPPNTNTTAPSSSNEIPLRTPPAHGTTLEGADQIWTASEGGGGEWLSGYTQEDTITQSMPPYPPRSSTPGGSESLSPAQPSRAPGVSPQGSIRGETNPFKRKDLAQGHPQLVLSPADAPQYDAAAQNPDMQGYPSPAFANMSISDASHNPWQTSPFDNEGGAQSNSSIPPFPDDFDSVSGPLAADSSFAHPSSNHMPYDTASSSTHALSSFSSDQKPDVWSQQAVPGDQEYPSSTGGAQIFPGTPHENNNVDYTIGKGKPSDGGHTPGDGQSPRTDAATDDWNLIDFGADEPDVTRHKQPEGLFPPVAQGIPSSSSQPSLLDETRDVPRSSSRHVDSKSETYQIKNITWHDHKAAKPLRTSPILVQNANGPCPLVALVNALTLTTPADMADTVLVQVLRSREHISLGLLLDAVFDELMSPRRSHEDFLLPDVGELYEFLKSLHTGMNVNPRFIPSPEAIQAFSRTSLTNLDPADREGLMPGTFENTQEMAFYAAFSLPLIHGWLPQKTDPVYDAFCRQAPTYEDAQNLLFREEEFERRLDDATDIGLSENEQQLYQDILTIKSFLSTSATQLTSWGLEVIARAMKPGMIAILFRNDHFSTLYLHPETEQLLVLVTDAGYASHAEVVWETLTDVNGLNAQFLSGDFRSVGGLGNRQAGASLDGQSNQIGTAQNSGRVAENHGDWAHDGSAGRQGQGSGLPNSQSDNVQEDHDLALALQLQEEEDERHRQEQARRQRERQLSEQYIEQQARQPDRPAGHNAGGGHAGPGGNGPANSSLASARTSSNYMGVPPGVVMGRRLGGQTAAVQSTGQQPVRPLVPPVIPQRRAPVNRPADEGADDAPPSYEQAQHSTPYVPPVGHPSHPGSSLEPTSQRQSSGSGLQQQLQRQQPAPTSVVSRPGPTSPPLRPAVSSGRVRPQQGGLAGPSGGSRDRDCTLM